MEKAEETTSKAQGGPSGFDSGRNQRSFEAPSAMAAFPASRRGSLAQSQDLALLQLSSTASVDLRFRRAESLLPCGLTHDELRELIGRGDGGMARTWSVAREGGGGVAEASRGEGGKQG